VAVSASHEPIAGLIGAVLPTGILAGDIELPHGSSGDIGVTGLRTTTASAVTGPWPVILTSYGACRPGITVSGAELFATSAVSGETATGGKAVRRVSGVGELCHETWTGLTSDLPVGALGTTVAVMAPRLVSPCGSRPILQMS
jgi:hypothetical protein